MARQEVQQYQEISASALLSTKQHPGSGNGSRTSRLSDRQPPATGVTLVVAEATGAAHSPFVATSLGLDPGIPEPSGVLVMGMLLP